MKKSARGFTLVELLVVISIIAILSVIGLTVFSGVQKNARDARRRADIQAISKALEAHYGDTSCGATAGTYCAPEDRWFASGRTPKPPEGGDYLGGPDDEDTTFTLKAILETANGNCPHPETAVANGAYCISEQQ